MASPRAEDVSPLPAPPPLSPPCDVPATDIAAPATLPNATQALQKGEKIRILAIGSSSTFGSGASSKSRSYPSQLEGILEHALRGADIAIINRGIPGEVAEITAERIKSEVALRKPDLVLWQLGTNDALARVPPQDFKSTVRSTLRWLKDNQIDVVLVGVQYTSRLARDANYIAIRNSLLNSDAKCNTQRFEPTRFSFPRSRLRIFEMQRMAAAREGKSDLSLVSPSVPGVSVAENRRRGKHSLRPPLRCDAVHRPNKSQFAVDGGR